MDSDTMTLRSSRLKWLLVTVGAVGFVVGGLWVRAERPLLAWTLIVFFGLGGALTLFRALGPTAFLLLTPEGFEEHLVVRTIRLPWTAVDHFEVYRIPQGRTKMVGFYYADGYVPPMSKQLEQTLNNRLLHAPDSALGDTYGTRVDKLAALMNKWLEASRASTPPDGAEPPTSRGSGAGASPCGRRRPPRSCPWSPG